MNSATPPVSHAPLPWKVRYNVAGDECFIEARIEGKPYGQEILGDDYFPELSRTADCIFIVETVNAKATTAAELERVKAVLTQIVEQVPKMIEECDEQNLSAEDALNHVRNLARQALKP